jgi:hypothetical protein
MPIFFISGLPPEAGNNVRDASFLVSTPEFGSDFPFVVEVFSKIQVCSATEHVIYSDFISVNMRRITFQPDFLSLDVWKKSQTIRPFISDAFSYWAETPPVSGRWSKFSHNFLLDIC